MVWVDYLIIGIILISAVISIIRGFVKEVFSLITWIVAFWVAILFYSHLSTLLANYIETPSIRLFLAFFTLFAVTLILGALVNHVISSMVEKTGLTGTDRALGVVFGLLRGVAIVIVLVLGAGATPMPKDVWWQQSLLLEHFVELANSIKVLLPDDIAQHIHYN
jgi:membrane protein required for colicin V production